MRSALVSRRSSRRRADDGCDELCERPSSSAATPAAQQQRLLSSSPASASSPWSSPAAATTHAHDERKHFIASVDDEQINDSARRSEQRQARAIDATPCARHPPGRWRWRTSRLDELAPPWRSRPTKSSLRSGALVAGLLLLVLLTVAGVVRWRGSRRVDGGGGGDGDEASLLRAYRDRTTADFRSVYSGWFCLQRDFYLIFCCSAIVAVAFLVVALRWLDVFGDAEAKRNVILRAFARARVLVSSCAFDMD